MPRLKIKQKKDDKYYVAPTLANFVRMIRGESLFLLEPVNGNRNIHLCFGVGKVTHIETGKEMDIVKMKFGRRYSRMVIVCQPNARRQIYAIKKGHYATIYGHFCYYKKGNKANTVLFASALQDWYVPKAYDIKNYDSDILDDIEQETEQNMLNFLDDILGGDKL